jgi:regulator of nucleoside diphosphate kinase
MAKHVFISDSEIQRLRAVVDQHLEGRDGVTAERLAAELDRATVVDHDRLPADAVTIESRVTFEEEQSGTVREVVLVYPRAADASAGRISVLAPVGAALLGLRTGDRIEWPLPDGRTAKIRIREVTRRDDAGRDSAA